MSVCSTEATQALSWGTKTNNWRTAGCGNPLCCKNPQKVFSTVSWSATRRVRDNISCKRLGLVKSFWDMFYLYSWQNWDSVIWIDTLKSEWSQWSWNYVYMLWGSHYQSCHGLSPSQTCSDCQNCALRQKRLWTETKSYHFTQFYGSWKLVAGF